MVQRHIGWGRVVTVSAAGLFLVTAVAGCSTTGHKDAALRTARNFVAAVIKHDGSDACALLTDDARESVSGATDESCADAVVNVQEKGQTVGKVAVWGDSAQVHIGGDVVFLLREPAGWLVSAAGCTPQPDAPYKCDVDG